MHTKFPFSLLSMSWEGEESEEPMGGKATSTCRSFRLVSNSLSSSSVGGAVEVWHDGGYLGEGGEPGMRGGRAWGRARGRGGLSSSLSSSLSVPSITTSPPLPAPIERRNDSNMYNAARQGDLEEVRRLYEDGASADSSGGPGDSSALMMASFLGHLRVVRYLISQCVTRIMLLL